MILNILLLACGWQLAVLLLTGIGRSGMRYRIKESAELPGLFNVEFRHVLWVGPWLTCVAYLPRPAAEAAVLLYRVAK